MQTRLHKRIKLDLVELDGKMFLIDNVEILDISLGGVSLKVDRGLNIGKEYLITLIDKDKSIDVKGIAIHSTLRGTVQDNGERATSHTARIKFKGGQTAKIAGILNLMQPFKKEEVPVTADRRLNVRFRFTIPLDTILSHSAQLKVKKITLGSMIIHSEQALDINSLIPMELSLNTNGPVSFSGKIVACRSIKGNGRALYETEVEFSDLTDRGRTLLEMFIDDLADTLLTNDSKRASAARFND